MTALTKLQNNHEHDKQSVGYVNYINLKYEAIYTQGIFGGAEWNSICGPNIFLNENEVSWGLNLQLLNNSLPPELQQLYSYETLYCDENNNVNVLWAFIP